MLTIEKKPYFYKKKTQVLKFFNVDKEKKKLIPFYIRTNYALKRTSIKT